MTMLKKWSIKTLSIITISGACLQLNVAQASPTLPKLNNAASAPQIAPPAPNLNARGFVLMDANSGKILAQKNMNTIMPPASLTKLMTLYVASKAIASGQISLQDKVRVSKDAWKRGGSRMFLKLGSWVPVRDLIEGIIVASGNDACVALAEYIAGNETSFARIMNANAAKLGMKNTHYVDSTGLPKRGHHSTPYDLALLTRHIIQDFPQDYSWYKQKWIKYNGIKQPNRNRLLWRDPSVDGLKTGHTKAAGYCLISSANRKGMRLISVVMGTPSDSDRATDSQILLNWGYRFYKTHKLFSGLTPLANPRIWLGANSHTNLGLVKPLYITIPSGSFSQLSAKLNLNNNIKAPVTKGQRYGSIVVSLNHRVIKTVPLIALQNDAEGGLWTRLSDHVGLFFHNILS